MLVVRRKLRFIFLSAGGVIAIEPTQNNRGDTAQTGQSNGAARFTGRLSGRCAGLSGLVGTVDAVVGRESSCASTDSINLLVLRGFLSATLSSL